MNPQPLHLMILTLSLNGKSLKHKPRLIKQEDKVVIAPAIIKRPKIFFIGNGR